MTPHPHPIKMIITPPPPPPPPTNYPGVSIPQVAYLASREGGNEHQNIIYKVGVLK